MKLLFAHDHIFYKFNNQFYSSGGLSKEILERYTKIYDEVTIVSRHEKIDTYNNKLTLASTERVNFVEIPNFNSIKNLTSFSKAKKIIDIEISSSDAIIARLPSSIGSVAVSAAIKHIKPYLLEVVACPWDAFWNHSLNGKMLAPIMYYKTKKFVNNSPYTVFVTNEFLQRRYPSRGISVGCSDVVLPVLSEDVLDKRLEKIKKMSKGTPIIIGTTAAVNVKYKGQRYIIEAIAYLNKQGFNFEYHLAGGGDNSILKSIAKKYEVLDKVKFLGSIPHKNVFEYLDNIDIYVQPSKQEGLPRALVEAMSRGCPSFGSTTGGIPELLNRKHIFKNGNVKEICRVLKNMDKETMYQEAIRSFNKAKEYDNNLLNKKRSDFYKKFALFCESGVENEV